ncbi:MBL fold metallo-hydrolase [Streptomonospora sp. S1-112]|uniref:MBL fold metallo-hydrolase n=1 Tax=Streptomonospora mangrovi TaxID=2883123 RepID=A0A9X3NLH2_9ACTN|nr:MBL fold metallo-hydrolase [Streptomonospora mangrovi]MDA0565939.1 MBL fold metallo-hydrolase [Streptomonospora mangrovi]
MASDSAAHRPDPDGTAPEAAPTPVSPVHHLVTSGTFRLDGGEWAVDNNVWIVGDDRSAVVIDAAHDHEAIARALGDRELMAVVCTHAHNDHINAAARLADLADAPILLHPADAELWAMVYPDREPDAPLLDGEVLSAGGVDLQVLHTPGHSPGAVSLYAPDLGTVFTGDTLFQGGPGATGRLFSHFPTIIDSIRGRLLSLPGDTVVRTGHGDPTTVGGEAPHLQEWIDRGY